MHGNTSEGCADLLGLIGTAAGGATTEMAATGETASSAPQSGQANRPWPCGTLSTALHPPHAMRNGAASGARRPGSGSARRGRRGMSSGGSA